ncbi:hypothetical protein QT865_22550, partial [Xanthomonas citri pv. citri]
MILDNFVPRAGYVEMRRGFVQQATGTPSEVQSLMIWRGGGPGLDKLFAAAGSVIYDATTPSSAVSPASTGYTSAKFQYVNVSTLGGRFILAFNGA